MPAKITEQKQLLTTQYVQSIERWNLMRQLIYAQKSMQLSAIFLNCLHEVKGCRKRWRRFLKVVPEVLYKIFHLVGKNLLYDLQIQPIQQ